MCIHGGEKKRKHYFSGFRQFVKRHHLFGRSFGDGEAMFNSLKFSWLKENFEILSSNATKWKKMCIAKAYNIAADRGHL